MATTRRAIAVLALKNLFSLLLVLGLASQGQAELTDTYESDEPLRPQLTGCKGSLDTMTSSERQQCRYYLEQTDKVNRYPYGKTQKVAAAEPFWPDSAKVVAVAQCDPKDNNFYLLVYKNGQLHRKWLTSPGKPGWHQGKPGDEPEPKHTILTDQDGLGANTSKNSKLNLTFDQIQKFGSWGNFVSYTTEGTHTVSARETYAGAKMYDPVWIGSKNGFAVHGTDDNNYPMLGKPASFGCLRLTKKNAKEFRELVDKAGHRNTKVYFAGYDCTQPITTTPSVPVPKDRPSEKTKTKKGPIGGFLKNIFKKPNRNRPVKPVKRENNR